MLKKSALAACAVAALVAGCATAAKPVPTPAPAAAPAPAPAPKPALGSFGVDMSGLDASVKPGDDFFRYAGGAWLKTATMPSDRTRWGSFDILRAQSETDVRAIVDDLAKSASNPGSIEQKIGDFYNAYLDTAAIDAKGLAPAQPTLAAIAAAKSHEDIARLIGRPDIPATSPIGFGFTLDEKNPDRYIIGVGHAGLGLDEREYYLKTDAESKALVAKYQAHVGRMLALAGSKTADADAAKIVAFETEIAKRHWPIAKRRERELTYNLKSRADLEKLAPEWPWAPMFDAAGLSKQPEFVVSEVDAMRPLAQLYRKTPVATLRAYLTYHYLHESADVLPKAFDDENFDFYGRTLNGQPEQRARWKRAVSGLDDTLGEGVGQIYVKRHFSAESKAKMVDLVENLRKAYGQRIDDLTWMTPETKKVAREKLAAFRVKVGYPDKWRDYASLEIKAGDAFGNAARARTFEWNYNLARLDKPTDKGEWGMNPQTVNAYYNPVWNEIVFPAAILQPPFFDLNADPAVNYGGIGGVIGHEMGHGFDDQGAKSDARGVLRV
ncbi:MAG: M13 family metallopeptidase, partial [Caulobacterales bacterium]